VAEYVPYDPHAEFLREPLQGYRLDGRSYVPMATDAAGALLSDALDMRLMLVNGRLCFVDRQTGRELLSPEEKLTEAEARAAAAEARAAELEARLREREGEASP
jgi:hypothetical protein